MPDSSRRTSRFVIEITRAVGETARRDASLVEVRIYEDNDGTADVRPITSLSTVDGQKGRYGREHLREALHRYADQIVDGMGDVETAEVTLWPAELRERLL